MRKKGKPVVKVVGGVREDSVFGSQYKNQDRVYSVMGVSPSITTKNNGYVLIRDEEELFED